jgi:serine/threonine protein kinase
MNSSATGQPASATDRISLWDQVEGELEAASSRRSKTGQRSQPRPFCIDGTHPDLYSLGCLLYELLTGTTVFEYSDPVAEIEAHLSRQPAPMRASRPQAPGELDALTGELWRRFPRLALPVPGRCSRDCSLTSRTCRRCPA